MMRRMINTMRKDERALAMGGDLSDAMSGRTGSISETYTGEENFTRVWSWDRNDIGDFIEGAHGKTSGKILSDKKEVKKMKRYGHAKFFDILKHHLLPITGLAMVSLLAFIAYQASKQDG
jgi:hypothetical protein